jgi:hypothetical protein
MSILIWLVVVCVVAFLWHCQIFKPLVWVQKAGRAPRALVRVDADHGRLSVRYDAPFLVKRFAPLLGRPSSRRRTSVAHQAYRLADALEWAQHERRRVRDGVWLWIERRQQPATRSS